MGKKTKVGKQRKDKFYKLAKETGYRSRASFKLLQLNRKFEFLHKSRVLIDLCAAPGGWLQVAQNAMPVSSLIIGVDLVPIRPIANVISLQEDITTDTCRQSLKKQLKTWKADVVLHDGAPNVGKNWIHDAYAQAHLTLSALKLATEFLVPNGWFITKVFRSRDYNSLIWVLEKLFKKVHATKPQASRTESAEIFVVCQGYRAPDRIDSKFLDASYLFKDVETKSSSNKLLQHTTKKPKAEGYEDGEKSVFFQLKATEFIFGDNHLEILSKSHQIVFDDEDIENHKTTTADIKEYCKDVKVLGKKEIRTLLNWRKNLQASVKLQGAKESEANLAPADEDDEKDADVQAAIDEGNLLEEMKYKDLKRKKKKILVEKRKLHEKLNLKMIIKDDEPIIQEDRELFTIKALKSKKDLKNLQDEDVDAHREEIKEDEPEEKKSFRSSYTTYDRHDEDYDVWHSVDTNDISEKDSESESEEEMEFTTTEKKDDDDKDELPVEETGTMNDNPLLVELMDNSQRVKATVDKWFDKDYLDVDEEDDLDLELLAQSTERKNTVAERRKSKSMDKNSCAEPPIADATMSGDSEGESEDEAPIPAEQIKKKKKKRVILDPEGLALGALMIHSKKARRDIIDSAYNRYASNDQNLPDWFVTDEAKHNRKEIPVSAEMVAEYRARLKEINARPIKKVVEAKSRKRQKAMRRLEKARKRAEAITENLDMSNREKNEQVQTIYKKALKKKDDGVTYVVAKKGGGKRGRRPPGVKGRYKMVDKRMRKDNRIQKNELKNSKQPKPRMTNNKKPKQRMTNKRKRK